MLRGKENIFGGCLSALRTAVFLSLALFPVTVHSVTVPAGDLAPYGAPDGQLNAADVLILQRFVLGELPPTADEVRIGDVAPLGNPDGALNAGDLVVLMRAVMGEITLPAVTLAPDAPVLDAGASPTHANPYPVTGTAAPGLTIDLYVNGQLQATVTAGVEGRFSFNAALTDGVNTLYATATEGNKTSASSNILTVDYVNTIPRTQRGVISQDTVWTPGTGESYIIDGDLTIDPGVTLSIQPGVDIKIDGFRTLNVNGVLDIRGAPAGRQVRITALANTTQSEQWFGIQVNAGGYASVDFAVVENANTGIWFNGGDGVVSNSVVRLAFTGIETTGTSAPLITGNTLSGNTFGILAKGRSQPSVTGNNLITGNDTGIGVQLNAQPLVTENNIYGNTWNYDARFHVGGANLVLDASRNYWGSGAPAQISAAVYDNGDSGGLPVVDFTPFLTQPNTGDGQLAVSQDNYLIGPVTTDLNLPAGNSYQVVGNVRVAQGASLSIDAGVTLRFHGAYGIRIDGDLQVRGTAVAPVLFTSATGAAEGDWGRVEITALSGGAAIDHAVFEYADAGIWFNGGTGTVTNSLFRYNSFGVDILGASSPLIQTSTFINNSEGIRAQGTGEAGGNPNPVVNNCRFEANTWHYDTGSFHDAANVRLNARNNWWGTTDAGAIAYDIYDISEETDTLPVSLPVVEFTPFLDAPGGNPVPGNYLYGTYNRNTVLTANTSYEVADDVLVMPGVVLTVEQGAQLQFDDDIWMVVRGQLQVQGTATNPVDFLWPDGPVGSGDFEWIEITAESSGSVIDYARFDFANTALWLNGGSATVSNSTFNNNVYGIDIYAGSTATVVGSAFAGNNNGVRLRSTLNTVVGPHNTFNSNGRGVWVQGGGAGGNPAPVVRGNNLSGNTWNYYTSNFSEPDGVTLDARLNWWGGTDSTAIDAGIYDAQDNPAGSPVVQYQPALDSLVTASTVLPPLLNALPTLTNQNPLTVAGSATPGIEVRLWVNGTQQAVSTADTAGRFNFAATLAEGVNRLYIVAFDGNAQSTPSTTFTVTLDTVAPVINLANPVNGGATNTATVIGQLSEPASLTINNAAVTSAADNSFMHPLSGLVDGPNTINLLATDPAGNSTAQTVNFTLDTVAPAVPDLAQLGIGVLNAGQVTIAGAAGSAEASARVSLTNSRTGETLAVTAATDGSFTVTIAAQAGDTLVLLVSDAAGNGAPTRLLQVAGSAPAPGLGIIIPLDGSSVMSDRIAVEGTFQGPANTGIRVNGVTAITVGDRFCASDVPLAPGLNTLTVTATTATGDSFSQSLAVTRTGPAALRLDTDQAESFVPATVTFSVTDRTGATLKTLDYDFDGDGTIDSTTADPTQPVQYIYTTPGCYTARVIAADDRGGIYNATQMVAVQGIPGIESRLKAVWYGMLGQLRNGNITGALNAMTGTMRAKYETLFVNLGPDLATVVDQLGTVIGGGVMDDVAELIIAREEEGAQVGFKVYLIRDSDGIWRIAEM